MAAADGSLDQALQNYVSSQFPEARITEQETIQSLWGGYGKIVRIFLESPSTETPSSVVIKCIIPPHNETGISHERKCKSYQVEQYFYDNYASKLDPLKCRVPKLISSSSNSNRTLFMLEDLNEAGYSQIRHQLSLKDAKLCVVWLANFHKTFLINTELQSQQLDIEGSRTDVSNNVKSTTADNIDKNSTGGGVWEQGSYWHLDTRPDEYENMDDRDPLKINAKAIDSILRNAKFKTLIHGDAKLANFLWSNHHGSNDDDSVSGVDFQYTGWGVGVIDIAYCIGKFPGVNKLSENVENELIDLYFNTLNADHEVEEEWRKLYCVAVVDFERFLAGWGRGGSSTTPWVRKGNIADKISQTLALI